MQAITIQKQELKKLIRDTLNEYFPKYEAVSNTEQKEIERIYKNHDFNQEINKDDFVEL